MNETSSVVSSLHKTIDAKVPPEHKKAYNRTVAAGLKLMFDDQTYPMMKEYMGMIKSPEQVPDHVAHGVVKGMSILMNESKGKLPIETSMAAAHQLMAHALDYVEQVMNIPVDKPMIAATTKATTQGMMDLIRQYSGLSQEQFDQVARGKGKDLIASSQSQQAAPQEAAPAEATPQEAPPQPGLAGEQMNAGV